MKALHELLKAHSQARSAASLKRLVAALVKADAGFAAPGLDLRSVAVLRGTLAGCRLAAVSSYDELIVLNRNQLAQAVGAEIARHLLDSSPPEPGFVSRAIERMPLHVVAELKKCGGDVTRVAATDLVVDLSERAFRQSLLPD